MYSSADFEARLESRRMEVQTIEAMSFYQQIGLGQRTAPRLRQLLQMVLTALFGR